MNGNSAYALVSGTIQVKNYPDLEERTVPVKISFYNEFHNEETFKREDIVEYNESRTVVSQDNKGWTDWWPLKGSFTAKDRICYKRLCKN